MIMRSPALAAVVVAILAGCLPTERLNEACEWVGDAPRALDLSRRADRKHLELDVRLAEDLGIRFGDATERTNLAPRRECTEALFATIVESHGVTRADIAGATGARDVGIDLLTVHLPLLLLFALAAALVAPRVERVFEPDERWLRWGVLLVIGMVVAGLAVPVAEMWAWQVETARLRNGHISYRAFRLPVARHRLEVWAVGVLVFGLVAAVRSLRARRAVSG